MIPVFRKKHQKTFEKIIHRVYFAVLNELDFYIKGNEHGFQN